MTGSLQVGATVNDGESVALDHLAQWTTRSIQVAVDSKIAIKRVHVPNIDIRMPGLWSTPQEKRSLLQVTWTKGHLSEEQHEQKYGPAQAWAWAANLEADQVCGARSQEVFSYAQATATDNIDRAARATCSWLGKRCSHMLAHDPVPRAKDLKFEAVPVAKKKVQKPGLNKRQQLLAATESVNPNTGHNWVITAKSKNLCIKRETCTLFVQQTDPVPLVEFVLQHPCRHRPAEPSLSAKIESSHDVINLGHLWSCSRCKASYSVRAPAKGRLAKKCQSKATKKEQATNAGVDATMTGFAALFFRDKQKQGRPGVPGQEPAQPEAAKQAPSLVRSSPAFGSAFWGPPVSPRPPRDFSPVRVDEVLLGNQKQGDGGAPPDPTDDPAATSTRPLHNKESLKRVGNEARGSQPRSKSPSQVPTSQPGSPVGVTFPPHFQAQVKEVGGTVLSSAEQLSRDPQPISTEATSARAPQPVGKESKARSSVVSGGAGNSSVTKPKAKAKKNKDTSSAPSVLQFFRKQD